MLLKTLKLTSFRNYESKTFTFTPGVNEISGPNGSGKTNLLEALFLLATGRSFRRVPLTDLIRHDATHFYIEALYERDDLDHTLSIGYDGTIRKILHDNAPVDTFSSLLGLLPSVLNAPHDIALISGAPSDRRRFLDIYLAQSDPTYLYHLARYSRALKQRNALLKERVTTALHAFEAEMTASATPLQEVRQRAIERFSAELDTVGKESFSLRYRPSHLDFAGHLERDLILGSTSSGPHRDDFHIVMDAKGAKKLSSEGQKRSFVSALKLLEHAHLSPALFCFDDFGAHLDPDRQAQLLARIETLPQSIITRPLR